LCDLSLHYRSVAKLDAAGDILQTIALDLLKRGHSEARVAKIVEGNFARLFGEVWK
jgi:microsomal dipeptidase-like Zn-dependent dipeptidase